MENHDFFAEIAMTKHPALQEGREKPPRQFESRYFETTQEAFPREEFEVAHKDYQERLMEFEEELRRLRDYYKPYLENRISIPRTVTVTELKKFDFRYLKPEEIFTGLSRNTASWQSVQIPDYRGPAGEQGKWRAYYRTSFRAERMGECERAVLRFQCVDYKALIYLNGNFVGQHEGFFAPFEFEISRFLMEENDLVVEVQNDIPILGEGPVLDGDKIYAAHGPGWDDPDTGWHHSPPGAGIFGKVTVEYRPFVYMDDIFVRPNIDLNYVELRIGITNYSNEIVQEYQLEVSVKPANFDGKEAAVSQFDLKYIGIGKNEYRYYINMADYRLWEGETPYLYAAVASLSKEGCLVNNRVRSFGMRKFISDAQSSPRGRFYLNNRPVILRGANEMGHLQQCVMKNDFSQLIDDILIAKMCHMNYIRITQRPVQEEIYDYLDRLGLMHQTDFPLFAFLRRNQTCEAIRQVEEMEKLIRSHPSSIMVSFINEAMAIRRTGDPSSNADKRFVTKGHRHMFRDELEAFFCAARRVIYIVNPDRVIKNVEGDYDPPTQEGMPDFHCYTMWYTNHAMPFGKLHRGYLPAVKEGYMTGCGEYGTEGLDHLAVMYNFYPKQWLTLEEDGSWIPDKIVRAQTNALHGDWFAEQNTMEEWVRESQQHQARATRLMTDAFRRRADYINQTAIHLLIDAWPSGWMKTIVGFDRIPKPAYFAYADSLVLLRVNLRSDRACVYSGEELTTEVWLLNDLPKEVQVTILVEVQMKGSMVGSYALTGRVQEVDAVLAGYVKLIVPDCKEKTIMKYKACIIDREGRYINGESLEYIVYPDERVIAMDSRVSCIGSEAVQIVQQLGCTREENYETADTIILSDYSKIDGERLYRLIEEGRNVLVLLQQEEEITVGKIRLWTAKCQSVFFAASDKALEQYQLAMLYNREADYIDILSERSIISNQEGKDLLYTYEKKGFDKVKGRKKKLPFVKQFSIGKGNLFAISLIICGRIKYNPNLDCLLRDCIAGRLEV